MLFTEAVGEGHAFNDRGAVIGIQLELRPGIRKAGKPIEDKHTRDIMSSRR